MTNKISYYKHNDYLLPSIILKEMKNGCMGKYGRLRREFLKEHRPITFNEMVLSETLFPHLYEVQDTAVKRMELLMEQLLVKYPSPNKKENQLAWVQHMNMLKAVAEELVLSELIYS